MTNATATTPRATASAKRVTKADKARERTLRATASTKMEGDIAAALHEALKAVLLDLANAPKEKPARKVKLKLTDGAARITVEFEIRAKSRKK